MKVREIMSSDVECLPRDASIVEASEMMRDNDIGSVPVCEGDSCVGIITDRDIAIRAVSKGRDLEGMKVSEIMSPDVASVSEDDDVKKAESMMEERGVRRLIVLDRSRKLCGVVSLGDLSGADETLAGRVVGKVTEPVHAKHGLA
jgi:CBS domain-containing protein